MLAGSSSACIFVAEVVLFCSLFFAKLIFGIDPGLKRRGFARTINVLQELPSISDFCSSLKLALDFDFEFFFKFSNLFLDLPVGCERYSPQ